jgi:hypothetical protein
MSNEIIRTVENGVEFFTVTETGESGMSVSGLALMCGVAHQTVNELLQKSVAGKPDVESLKPLQGKEFELQAKHSYKNARIIADWACGCAIEYYALDARRTTTEAKRALRLFRDAGIRVFIQKMTGWQQPEPQPELNSTEPTIAQIESVFAGLYKFPIKPELIESAKLSAISRSIPTLTPSVEEAKRLLSNALVIEEVPMTPTEIGVEIAKKLNLNPVPSANKINQILIDKGLQVAEHSINRFGKKRIQYKLTDLGEKYGQMQLEQARNGNKTLVIVRWFSTVIDAIAESF